MTIFIVLVTYLGYLKRMDKRVTVYIYIRIKIRKIHKILA